jgi:hypothetical protein
VHGDLYEIEVKEGRCKKPECDSDAEYDARSGFLAGKAIRPCLEYGHKKTVPAMAGTAFPSER